MLSRVSTYRCQCKCDYRACWACKPLRNCIDSFRASFGTADCIRADWLRIRRYLSKESFSVGQHGKERSTNLPTQVLPSRRRPWGHVHMGPVGVFTHPYSHWVTDEQFALVSRTMYVKYCRASDLSRSSYCIVHPRRFCRHSRRTHRKHGWWACISLSLSSSS